MQRNQKFSTMSDQTIYIISHYLTYVVLVKKKYATNAFAYVMCLITELII